MTRDLMVRGIALWSRRFCDLAVLAGWSEGCASTELLDRPTGRLLVTRAGHGSARDLVTPPRPVSRCDETDFVMRTAYCLEPA